MVPVGKILRTTCGRLATSVSLTLSEGLVGTMLASSSTAPRKILTRLSQSLTALSSRRVTARLLRFACRKTPLRQGNTVPRPLAAHTLSTMTAAHSAGGVIVTSAMTAAVAATSAATAEETATSVAATVAALVTIAASVTTLRRLLQVLEAAGVLTRGATALVMTAALAAAAAATESATSALVLALLALLQAGAPTEGAGAQKLMLRRAMMIAATAAAASRAMRIAVLTPAAASRARSSLAQLLWLSRHHLLLGFPKRSLSWIEARAWTRHWSRIKRGELGQA